MFATTSTVHSSAMAPSNSIGSDLRGSMGSDPRDFMDRDDDSLNLSDLLSYSGADSNTTSSLADSPEDEKLGMNDISRRFTAPAVMHSATVMSSTGSDSLNSSVATSANADPYSDPALDFMSTFIKQEDIDELDEIKPTEVQKPRRRRSVPKAKSKKKLNADQRKAHNKIERKYRININSKIANLQKLVPWMSHERVAFEVGSLNCMPNPDERGLNKSMVLDIVTKYITQLKAENEELHQYVENITGKPYVRRHQ